MENNENDNLVIFVLDIDSLIIYVRYNILSFQRALYICFHFLFL